MNQNSAVVQVAWTGFAEHNDAATNELLLIHKSFLKHDNRIDIMA